VDRGLNAMWLRVDGRAYVLVNLFGRRELEETRNP
jgi:hypothetical protein